MISASERTLSKMMTSSMSPVNHLSWAPECHRLAIVRPWPTTLMVPLCHVVFSKVPLTYSLMASSTGE